MAGLASAYLINADPCRRYEVEVSEKSHVALAPGCGRQLHTIAGQLVRPAIAVFTPRASLLTNEADDDPELKEHEEALAVLRSHGVVLGDSEWRKMLWDDLGGRLVANDSEDVKWSKRPRALEPTSCHSATPKRDELLRLQVAG
ncbi:hypothetical protein PENNAL_c0117G06889 [Penicillium nalgiovense]|uniref:Uncharacterized protein n=1 Tax=Penicillium nalgiovense TaxID=60175 RepID=A0A1V6X5M8_PENNA|nr:hypothetical protein PENNAL_c0117G06889 [Penicillium nalgiovense]